MQTEYNTLTKDVSGSELKKMLINSCWQFFLNLLFFIKDKTWKILEYLETEKIPIYLEQLFLIVG